MTAGPSLQELSLAAVHARMRAAVTRDGPAAPLYAWLRDHLGWPDGGADHRDRSAKGIRPRVALAAWAAVGGADESKAAVDIAAAIELTHEFSLIHDDIEDRDLVRRGRATLWTTIGEAQAINAGDALFGIARGVLSGAALPSDVIVAAARRYDAACVQLAEGQSLDIAFESRSVGDVDREDYVDMVRRKTGALLGAAAALGALGAGASAATADALERWGEHLGVAFQIQDDVLGIWGDPAVTLKPAGHDLVRRKKSLPVLLAAADRTLSTPLRNAFAGDEPMTAATASSLAADMAERGLAEACRAEARRHAHSAQAALANASLRPGPSAMLAALAQQAVDRER